MKNQYERSSGNNNRPRINNRTRSRGDCRNWLEDSSNRSNSECAVSSRAEAVEAANRNGSNRR